MNNFSTSFRCYFSSISHRLGPAILASGVSNEVFNFNVGQNTPTWRNRGILSRQILGTSGILLNVHRRDLCHQHSYSLVFGIFSPYTFRLGRTESTTTTAAVTEAIAADVVVVLVQKT